jgi:predicted aldo/keto reductase-like oxidoreductase
MMLPESNLAIDHCKEKGDGANLPERPGGCFAQISPVPFFLHDFGNETLETEVISMREKNNELDRRGFMKRSAQATAAAAAAVLSTNTAHGAAPDDKKIPLTDALPTRELGKTKVELPMLGYGGAALPKKWGNTLSTEDRVKLVRHAYDSGIRYFDTAISYTYSDSQAIIGRALKDVRDNVFITTKVDFWDLSKPDGRITKVDKKEVARQVEMNLKELQSDYIDAILIHGTPGVEQMTVEQCMEVQDELAKARDKGLVRFVGFSAHHYFDKALDLISTGEFDLCMLAYGYLPRGHSRLFSPRTTELRNACLAKAHELQMGIVAMKVMGAGMLGGFGRKDLEKLPGAAIRYLLQDQRVHILTIGMRFPAEIDANIKTLAGDTTYTLEDRGLLTGVSAAVLSDENVRKMSVE